MFKKKSSEPDINYRKKYLEVSTLNEELGGANYELNQKVKELEKRLENTYELPEGAGMVVHYSNPYTGSIKLPTACSVVFDTEQAIVTFYNDNDDVIYTIDRHDFHSYEVGIK